jgi:hypothetical protein
MVITLELRQITKYYKTTPNTAVIYNGNLTLEKVGLKLPW